MCNTMLGPYIDGPKRSISSRRRPPSLRVEIVFSPSREVRLQQQQQRCSSE